MIIGLTGSIGTGKSTVSNYLISKGFVVIDSDRIAREIVAKGQDVLETITNVFGKEVLHPSGELNRKALGKIIFSDPEARKRLNDITHPAINKEMHRRIKEAKDGQNSLVFCDVPLLFEGKMADQFDEVWLVYVPRELQLERLIARDAISKDDANQKIDAQLSIESKKTMANKVIYNHESKEKTYEQIDRLIKEKALC